jgi:3-oxoacyl-[acyl-carrier protein] reductase
LQLLNQSAVIIGGSSGIGEAIARRFSQEGAQVAVVGTSLEKAVLVSESICSSGFKAKAYSADVRDSASLEILFDTISVDLGKIDILVNSAGVYYPTRLGDAPANELAAMVDINLTGTIHAINCVVPMMKAAKGGKIVNLASVAAYIGSKDYPIYCATKSAIVMLTRALALQLAPFNININAIAPGNTATPINEDIRTADEHAERREVINRTTPSNRSFSPPEEMASAALFLVGDNARAMHGSTMLLDEGRSAGW